MPVYRESDPPHHLFVQGQNLARGFDSRRPYEVARRTVKSARERL
jgi:hypothetical protein